MSDSGSPNPQQMAPSVGNERKAMCPETEASRGEGAMMKEILTTLAALRKAVDENARRTEQLQKSIESSRGESKELADMSGKHQACGGGSGSQRHNAPATNLHQLTGQEESEAEGSDTSGSMPEEKAGGNVRKSETTPMSPIRRETREVRLIQRRLDELSGKYEKDLPAKEDSSAVFTDEVMKTRIPSKFSHPRFKMYDGNSDPTEHVQHFKHAMILYGENDGLMCKVFPSSLEGPALTWFQNLEPRSIFNFTQLCRLFISQFIYSKKLYKEPDALLRIEKKDRETIREFTQRFRQEMLQIEGCKEDFAIMAYRRALPRHNALACSLVKKRPGTLVELYAQVDKYARAEEEGALPEVESRKRRLEPTRENQRPRGRDETAVRDQKPRWGQVKPRFKMPPGMLIPHLKDKPYFKWPPPMGGNPDNRNRAKYCAYHKDHGHRTAECINYWEHLNELLQEGYLDEFLERDENSRKIQNPSRQTAMIENEIAGIIDVIHGVVGNPLGKTRDRIAERIRKHESFLLEGDAGKKQRRAKEITFSEEDAGGVRHPHTDALVISVRIKNFEIRRVLVDPGSSVNVMFATPFRLLGESPSSLKPSPEPVTGFNGVPTASLGKAHFDVY